MPLYYVGSCSTVYALRVWLIEVADTHKGTSQASPSAIFLSLSHFLSHFLSRSLSLSLSLLFVFCLRPEEERERSFGQESAATEWGWTTLLSLHCILPTHVCHRVV